MPRVCQNLIIVPTTSRAPYQHHTNICQVLGRFAMFRYVHNFAIRTEGYVTNCDLFKVRKIAGGAQGRNRTTDTRIFSPLLYQLSYLGRPRALRVGLCNEGLPPCPAAGGVGCGLALALRLSPSKQPLNPPGLTMAACQGTTMQTDKDIWPDFEPGPLDELAEALPAANVLALARSFYSAVCACLDALETAGRESDWATIKEQAHDLKGVSGTFGASRLRQLAEQLEHTQEPSAAFVASMLQDMRKTTAVARGELERILSADISAAA